MNDLELLKKYTSKEEYEEKKEKLLNGYPVQYLIGNVEFYNLIINVNEDVLIPRFETEYLVKDVLQIIKEYNFNNPNILDIGTGSGCISIAIKKNLNCDITAIDKSNNAINLAKENALNNNTDINFINSSIEDYNSNNKFDIIVSNPPYVPFNSNVSDNIKYEPKDAIYAKDNGLYFYKLILKKSITLLNKKNIIFFEIGDNEYNSLLKLTKQYYPNSKIIFKKDLNGYDRYFYIINN